MIDRFRQDPEKLDKKPSQLRNRIRRAAKHAEKTGDRTKLDKELKIYAEVGFKPVHEWDLEELAHGMPRNRAGKFGGQRPKWITPEVTREVKSRLHSHTFGRLGANVDIAVQVVVKLMTSDDADEKGKPIVDARTKLAAAQFVIEHVIGKPQTVLEVNATDSVRQMFAQAIVLDDGRVDSHLAIEGEVIEDVDLNGED